MAQGRGVFLATVMSLLLIQAVFSLLTQPAGYAAGNVYCVVPPGESTGPFAACDQVYTSVQSAVDTAVPHSEIWVANGVYTDIHEYNGRYQVAYVDKSLTIRGGYTIPFSDPSDPKLHITMLDARDLGRVLFIMGDISVTIEGLHLTGGWSYPAGFSGGELGGGVYVDGATILLQNNVITGNHNGPAGGIDVTGYGAGVYLTDVQATLRHNLIQDNIGYDQSNGGGLAALHSIVWLQNNRIVSNTAGLRLSDESSFVTAAGGGAYFFESQVILENNVISHNVAQQAEENGSQNVYNTYAYGGGLALENSSGRLIANEIHDNLALDWGTSLGGGLYIAGSSVLTLTHNLIQANVGSLNWYGNGGGVVAASHENAAPAVTLHHNRIVSNMAVISGVLGIGGGVAVFSPYEEAPRSAITLTHNLILSNTAVFANGHGLGGGLTAGRSQLYLNHNNIAGNVAVYSGTHGYGGGFYLADNEVLLTGNLVERNKASVAGGGLVVEGGVVVMENTAVIDNQGDGLYLICNAHLAATHLTIARNSGPGLHLDLPPDCQGFAGEPLPSTAVLTNTILAGHAVGARITAGSSLSLQALLWHDTPIPFQAEPGAQVVITNQHFGDPRFAADGYHLLADSAAIGRGLPTPVTGDIDGQPRRTPPDLGADEFWFASSYLPIIRRTP
jgi:hypothetical protein